MTTQTTYRQDGFFSDLPLAVILGILILVYVLAFSVTSILTFHSFGMSAYDIGIHTQAIWKLSTGRGLFNTVRGLPIWGDHCWFFMVFYAPIYWLFPRVETLLILQSLALAVGAVPLAAIVYRCSGSRISGVFFSAAWLLSPALQNMNLENFHPEIFAAPLLLWAIERAYADRWFGYSVAISLAMLCKEDVALTAFALGFWIFFRNRKAGILTMAASIIWFVLCMKVFLPYFNEQGFFRFQGGYWFSQFWNNKFDPGFYWETVNQTRVANYGWRLGLPVLFLFLLNPLLAIAALPSFIVNVLSGNDYLISIDYHYNFQTLPVLYAAAASGSACLFQRYIKIRILCIVLAAAVLGASIWANIQWSQMRIDRVRQRLRNQYNFVQQSDFGKRFNDVGAYLPDDPDVPISVSHNLLPHLANRNEVYMFPNPFKVTYWGIKGENRPTPDRIEFIMLNTGVHEPADQAIVKRLLQASEFQVEKSDGNLMLARRLHGEAKKKIVDPMSLDPPEDHVLLLVYVSGSPVKSLSPLWGMNPDYELTTKKLDIPLTLGRLSSAEGVDLGGADNLRLFFTGRWQARGEQNVRFRIQADDGCRLYVDGKNIVDYEGIHAYGQKRVSRTIRLAAGWHTISLDYFEWGGEAGVKVEWAPDNGEFRTLETGQMLP